MADLVFHAVPYTFSSGILHHILHLQIERIVENMDRCRQTPARSCLAVSKKDF